MYSAEAQRDCAPINEWWPAAVSMLCRTGRAGNVTSLTELVRVIAVAPEGHCIAAPLQEALLTVLVDPEAVATFARLIEGLQGWLGSWGCRGGCVIEGWCREGGGGHVSRV
ncbi:MED34 [Symbiodinium microadriaticum]|nr:MED34 [Symbiodinium microadriaticum]